MELIRLNKIFTRIFHEEHHIIALEQQLSTMNLEDNVIFARFGQDEELRSMIPKILSQSDLSSGSEAKILLAHLLDA